MIRKLEKLFEENWDEIRGKIKRNWGKLTSDDIKQIDGSYDIFIGKLKRAYGYGLDEVENSIEDFFSSEGIAEAKNKIAKLKDDTADKVINLKDSLQSSLQECAQNFLSKSLQVEENVVDYVKNNPLKVIGIAAVTSLVISKFFDSRS